MTLDESVAQQDVPSGQQAQPYSPSEGEQSGELVISCVRVSVVITLCTELLTDFALTVGSTEEVGQDESHQTQQQPPTDDSGIISYEWVIFTVKTHHHKFCLEGSTCREGSMMQASLGMQE